MLSPGTRLGSYEIIGGIGAGGMGEVYRARDTKLGRDVALKVLPDSLASDGERVARFQREAKVLASLNHPNIATIHGFEDAAGVHALVMELVEGPTLRERICGVVGAGPVKSSGTPEPRLKPAPTNAISIPIEEALPIAKQICEGFEYAHERGIIHRDLKPANVKITPEGTVKILDFGLAKAIEGDPSTASAENSPTLSAMATRAGYLLGTAAYMSPEQARGKKADRRADIWAFGVVLFEMLSGRRLFAGETTSDTLASVIRAEPEWNELPAQTPRRIRELLQRCLKKDPRQRLQAIGEARIAIEEVLSGTGAALGEDAISQPQNRWRRALPWALFGATGIALVVALGAYLLRAPPSAPATVAQIPPPAGANFAFEDPNGGLPAISPDGRKLAFAAIGSEGKRQLWVRPLDAATAQPLAGTDGAGYPFWSPDSRSIGFFANGKLNRIDASGGPVIALADVAAGRGGAWGADDTILFNPLPTGPLYRVPASGGTPQQVTKLDASRRATGYRWPQFLPDGKHFLFYAFSSLSQNNGAYAASLDGGAPKLLVQSDSNAIYAPPGYLLFVRQGTLMAQRFDANRLRLTGEATPLSEHVGVGSFGFGGIFSVSENGLLVYQAGNDTAGNGRLLWFDRSGKQIGETGTPDNIFTPSLSPDGRKLAVAILPGGASPQLWVYDLARGIKARLTFSEDNVGPAWSPDGKTIAFMSGRSGPFHLYQKAADGTGSTSPLVVDNASETSPSWSADGRYLLFARRAAPSDSKNEIWAKPLLGSRKPFPVVQNPQFNMDTPALSPDGKWLSYASDESGRPEIYVVPFLHGSGKWEISSSGGSWPRWRQDGRELFYLSPDHKMMSAEISVQGATIAIGKVAPLFQMNPVVRPGWIYDVSADGKKFVVVTQVAQEAGEPLTLVANWPALLKKR